MMEDKRAHERIDQLDKYIMQHTEDIQRIEKSVEENTKLTRSIEVNTGEIVEIMRGAKGVMLIITTLAKVGIAIAAVYAVWHGFVMYLRGQ